jgi:transcription initiation factor TFIIB
MRVHKKIRRSFGLPVEATNAHDLLPRYASQLQLQTETFERATALLEELRVKGIVRGRRPETVIAAVVYIACKETGDLRTQRVISNATGVVEVTIRNMIKDIQRLSALMSER